MAKGKKGVQVDELFLSLGIDTSDLEADLIGADKSVSDGIAILKTKMLQNKLKMEIDQSAFVGAENSMAAVANRTQHLTTQMNLQKVTVAALSAAYQKATADENLSAAAKDRMLTRLLREQKAETDLARQIKETNGAVIGRGSGRRNRTGRDNFPFVKIRHVDWRNSRNSGSVRD